MSTLGPTTEATDGSTAEEGTVTTDGQEARAASPTSVATATGDGRQARGGPAPRLQSEPTHLTDAAAPDRATALLAAMTLEEKTAQLVGYWLDQNGVVAPMQGEMAAAQDGTTLAEITRHGIGQFTRV